MSVKELVLPQRLTSLSVVDSLKLDAFDLKGIEHCNIRMTGCNYAEPAALMLFAAKIRRIIKSNKEVNFELWTRENNFTGWADHIGFFRFLGFKRGNAPGTALGSSNYTPVTIYEIADLQKEAGETPIGHFVSNTVRSLARNLSQQSSGPVFDLVEYSLREIVRNAAEHSRGTKIALLGQCWQAKKMAEIVVMDNGVGIAENLYENELLDCRTNREALKFALMPGITGVPLDERMKQDDHWGNSGFGMYVTSRFCAENGLFRVVSGDSALSLGGDVQVEDSWKFAGTFVQMKLSFRNARQKVGRIKEITEEGKGAFGELIKDHPINASTASTMLASQFAKQTWR